ncbi:response regulator [Thermanaeromonas sp. C210]|uniref:response regulator n=1 Tax=Thermanaeromonas sp. C210 TaxID=2731925 RepID=UPI00155B5051|nr:response regulator [Thermanaeromonas sp. C210]GFN22044.1 sporulation initiation phosphotransferase F [Thermanaeromonas sp. C210]
MDKPPRLLVVDDEPGVRLLLELLFKDEGFQVAVAANGLQAIQQVNAFQPDVVIMDVKMPLMDGLEALPHIKASSPTTKVIIVTAYLGAANEKELWERGASGFLLKPFDLEEIKAEVRRVMYLETQAYGT